MKVTFEEVRTLAEKFLALADELNELVSAYFVSEAPEAVAAYNKVIEANRAFNKAYTTYYGEPMIQPCLDYELAESVL